MQALRATPFIAFFSLFGFGLLALGPSEVGSRIFGATLGLVVGAVAVRAALSGRVVASERGVQFRGIFRTHFVDWSTVRSFQVSAAPVGATDYRLCVLAIVDSSGTTHLFKDFCSSASPQGRPSRVATVVDALNQHLTAYGAGAHQAPDAPSS